MTDIFENIEKSWAPIRDEIYRAYVERVTKSFAAYGEKYGVVTYGSYRKYGYAAEVHFRDFRSYVRDASGRGSCGMNDELAINQEYLEKKAMQWAQGCVDAFVEKLKGKLGDLSDVKLTYKQNGAFHIDGIAKDGAKVHVDQQVVYKVSNRGTWFCQWPARIYVDGEFHSEKQFKERG